MDSTLNMTFSMTFIFLSLLLDPMAGNPDAARLFEDLLSNYNKLVRPVKNSSFPIQIQFKLKLLQILDVHEKNQVMSINGWLVHIWNDYKLSWDPESYGGITTMHIPAQLIWLPDIILYNNADGSPQVTTLIKAHVANNGKVLWEPPVIYNSMCEIDIEWFPFDEQQCRMKFGSWTYYGTELDMVHLDQDNVTIGRDKDGDKSWEVERGIDIEEYQESVEWDLMTIRGSRHYKSYPCCSYPFIDITYFINIRRKTLFYTINLITPCVGITFLTSLVFFLPSASNNKITLSVSVLVSLTVFFLLLIEIIPPTSLVIPLMARYLIFTMILVSLSVWATVVVINIHYSSASGKPMPTWVRCIFIDFLPQILCIANKRKLDKNRSKIKDQLPQFVAQFANTAFGGETNITPRSVTEIRGNRLARMGSNSSRGSYDETESEFNKLQETTNELRLKLLESPNARIKRRKAQQIRDANLVEQMKIRACKNICYIGYKLRQRELEEQLKEDWKYVAMVIDRILLVVFSIAIPIGTIIIILSAPSLRDTRLPVSDIVKAESAGKNGMLT